MDLAAAPREGLHTLYISPLKALAVDIARNLMAPIEGMALPIRVETRTGDTPANRRARQRAAPPHILLTTPESLALLKSIEKDGVVTAGNASQQNDGASACLVVAEELLEPLGLEPMAWLTGWAAAGCDPSRMGIGPVPAVERTDRLPSRLAPSVRVATAEVTEPAVVETTTV